MMTYMYVQSTQEFFFHFSELENNSGFKLQMKNFQVDVNLSSLFKIHSLYRNKNISWHKKFLFKCLRDNWESWPLNTGNAV